MRRRALRALLASPPNAGRWMCEPDCGAWTAQLGNEPTTKTNTRMQPHRLAETEYKSLSRKRKRPEPRASTQSQRQRLTGEPIHESLSRTNFELRNPIEIDGLAGDPQIMDVLHGEPTLGRAAERLGALRNTGQPNVALSRRGPATVGLVPAKPQRRLEHPVSRRECDGCKQAAPQQPNAEYPTPQPQNHRRLHKPWCAFSSTEGQPLRQLGRTSPRRAPMGAGA